MKKLAILIVLILPLFSSCHKLKNERMMDLVQSKEHDPRLIGWWESVNAQEKYYIYFDGKTEWEKKTYRIDEEGAPKAYGGTWYWYTENGILYYFRKATAVTGVIDAKSGYVISEDGTIFEMMSDGSRHKKCEAPLIKHPNE